MASQDYNIIVRVESLGEGSSTSPKVGGRKTQSWAKGFENKRFKEQMNRARSGMAFHILSEGSDLLTQNIGAYTGNGELSAGIATAKRVGAHALLMMANPALGVTALAFDVAGEAIDYHINKRNSRLQAEVLRSISGNTANSGNRYRGKRL